MTSWGVLLSEAQNINAVALYPWLMLPVVPVIVVVVPLRSGKLLSTSVWIGRRLAFNFMGDGLRDAADPYKTG